MSNENRFLRFIRKYFPVKSILFTRFIFGHYYSFKCRKQHLIFAKLYCVGVSLVFPISLHMIRNFTIDIGLAHIMEYVVSIWMSFVEDICFTKFYSTVKRNDLDFGLGRVNIGTSRLYFAFLLISALRMLEHIVQMTFHNPFEFIFMTFGFISTSIDYSNLMRILTFDVLYERMMILRKYFEDIFRQPTDDAAKVSEVKRGLNMYKNLLNNLQFLDKIQATFTIALGFRFLKSIAYLQSIFTSTGTDRIVQLCLYTVEEVCAGLLVCSPSALIELTYNEAQKIEWLLRSQLAQGIDSSLQEGLSRALGYFRLRAFQLRLWYTVPMDSSLQLFFVSLVFTYALVVLQFYRIL